MMKIASPELHRQLRGASSAIAYVVSQSRNGWVSTARKATTNNGPGRKGIASGGEDRPREDPVERPAVELDPVDGKSKRSEDVDVGRVGSEQAGRKGEA